MEGIVLGDGNSDDDGDDDGPPGQQEMGCWPEEEMTSRLCSLAELNQSFETDTRWHELDRHSCFKGA